MFFQHDHKLRSEAGCVKYVIADPLKIIAALRSPSVTSWRDLRSVVGYMRNAKRNGRADPVIGCVRALGLEPAALRLFRWRRTFPTRQRYAAAIRAEYDRLGRTPIGAELAAVFGTAPTGVSCLLKGVFGSPERAMAYVGIPHRSHTGPREWRRGQPIRLAAIEASDPGRGSDTGVRRHPEGES